MTEEEKGWLRLHITRGLGRNGLLRLMTAFGSLEAILSTAPALWSRRAGIRESVAADFPTADDPRLADAVRALEKTGASIVSFWDSERYPPLLRQIHDPPALLYVRGTLPSPEAFAVVGARQASSGGRQLTLETCRELASRGIAIISGLARGIDTAAHQGALDGNGVTAAVLGCGIDSIYPPENTPLSRRIIERGAILSEYPPGTPPLPGHFPGRNRIISGLSRGVLIVEAAEGSGSLITADFALEQGREVFAVPGAVFSPTSQGVNRLLKDGARLVTEPRDILEVIWPQIPSPAIHQKEECFAGSLTGSARDIYGRLGNEPLHIDDLARTTGLTPMEVSAILLHLELQGGVDQLPGMRYVRSRKP